MWLVLDIGNSAVKGGLFDQAALQQVFQVDLDEAALRNAPAATWQNTLASRLEDAAIERIGVASVVPTLNPALGDALTALTGRPVETLRADLRLPFELAYATPQTLGIDRLVAAAAAWDRYGAGEARSVIALDAGTAVTLEVVTRAGIYRGGTIGPGPRLLARALQTGTAQLPAVTLELPPDVVGRSTQEALQSGVMWGWIESVRGLLARVEATLDDPPFVVATGGWSALLAQHLDSIDAVAPHLVLEGIRVLMTLNPPADS